MLQHLAQALMTTREACLLTSLWPLPTLGIFKLPDHGPAVPLSSHTLPYPEVFHSRTQPPVSGTAKVSDVRPLRSSGPHPSSVPQRPAPPPMKLTSSLSMQPGGRTPPQVSPGKAQRGSAPTQGHRAPPIGVELDCGRAPSTHRKCGGSRTAGASVSFFLFFFFFGTRA